MNSLVEEISELKSIKTARGLISLSFRCGVKIVNNVEVPQYVKSTWSKISQKRFFRKNRREYGLQPELLKGEIEHSVIDRSNFANLRHI